MSITSQIHNELVIELMEMLFEVSHGVNSSAMIVIESMAVRIIVLAAKENNLDQKLLLNTFLNGVKKRVNENVEPIFNM